METKLPEDTVAILEPLLGVLQAQYRENPEFNEVFDAGDPVVVRGLKDPDQTYSYSPSEVLFWVDRDVYNDELSSWDGQRTVEKHQDAMAFLRSTDQVGVFQAMVDSLRRGRIVPFVGAGLSRACGYPTWREALEKVAGKIGEVDSTRVRSALDAYDYLGAAQVIHDTSADQFNHFIKTEFRRRSDIGAGAVTLLPELTRGCLVSTNFDELIEETFLQSSKAFDGYMYGMQQGNGFVPKFLRGERCILKLHGNAGEESSYVFTARQYDQAYGDPLGFHHQLPRALRHIYISNSLLFLGCSLEKDRTLDLFQTVVSENSFDIPDHYALVPEPVSKAERNRKHDSLLRLRIQPLWYPALENDHSLVEALLRLAIAVAKNEVPFE